MAKPRTPAAKAKATGADVKNPARHKGRRAPAGGVPLGGPSAHLGLYEKRAFERFRAELPWLKESHRLLVEIASKYRGLLLDPDVPLVGLQTMQELRRCLGALGATPADESKVSIASGDEEDPDEARFQAAAGRSSAPPPPRPVQH